MHVVTSLCGVLSQAMYAQLRSNTRGSATPGGGIPPGPRSSGLVSSPFAAAGNTPAQVTPNHSPGVTPTTPLDTAGVAPPPPPSGNNADSPSKASPPSPFGAAARIPRANSQAS